MLAVKADYEAGQATVGTELGSDVPVGEILAALESIGYSGELVEGEGTRAEGQGTRAEGTSSSFNE